MKKKPSRNTWLYIVLVMVLLAVIGVLLFLLLRPKDDGQSVERRNRDPNAAVGQHEGKSQEELVAELNKIVADGMFNISINSSVVMEHGGSEAELRIENIAANRHLMDVVLTRDDTGEVLYASGLIEPGYHIQSVPLDVTLEKGVYTATAVFTAYDLETEAEAGQAAARITITVRN